MLSQFRTFFASQNRFFLFISRVLEKRVQKIRASCTGYTMPSNHDDVVLSLLNACDHVGKIVEMRTVFPALLYQICIALSTAPNPLEEWNEYKTGLHLLLTGPTFGITPFGGTKLLLPELSFAPGTFSFAQSVAVARFFTTHMQKLAHMQNGWEEYMSKITRQLCSLNGTQRQDFETRHVHVLTL